jgi:hypothetical protein
VYYRYKVNTFTYDTSKHWISSSHNISYNNYLFEFRLNTINSTETNLKIGRTKRLTTFDTVGVYLLQCLKPFYFELDTFSTFSKVVKIGNIWQKPYGRQFDSVEVLGAKSMPYITPVDTIINNIACYYVTVVDTNTNNYAIEMKAILLKKKYFNSLNKIGGANFPDKDYCVVGFAGYSHKNHDGFIQEIDELRPLTKKEINICKSMIAKTTLARTDTIK